MTMRDYLVAFCDHSMHLKDLGFLVLRHGAEEFGHSIPSLFGTGKRNCRNTRKHSFNIVGQCCKHLRDIASVKAVIEALYHLPVVLGTH